MSIDWDRDLCWLVFHRLVVSNNTVYVLGGKGLLTADKQRLLPEKKAKDGSISKDQAFPNSHLRILDFSKSVDLRTDYITKAIYLPETIPRMAAHMLFLSRTYNTMYAWGGFGSHLPEDLDFSRIFDNNGKPLVGSSIPPDMGSQVWGYSLDRQTWLADVAWNNGLDGLNGMLSYATGTYDITHDTGWVFAYSDFIQFDMSKVSHPLGEVVNAQTNKGLDVGITAYSEMVYIAEYGAEGILIMLGGSDVSGSVKQRLRAVWIFDIATKTWYDQETTTSESEFPRERMQFCSIVVKAQDNSSHSIYIYGGSEITKSGVDTPLGDVWVLSVPAFRWIRVFNPGTSNSFNLHSHQCTKLQDRYMMVYQGQRLHDLMGVSSPLCNDPTNTYNGIKLFDLSSLRWTTEFVFSGSSWKYLLPPKVSDIIGGNASGSATLTRPSPDFSDSKLSEIFKYRSPPDLNSTPSPTPDSGLTNNPAGGTSSPSKPFLAGVIGALSMLILILIAILLVVHRRKHKKKQQALAGAATSNYSPQSFVYPRAELSVPIHHKHEDLAVLPPTLQQLEYSQTAVPDVAFPTEAPRELESYTTHGNPTPLLAGGEPLPNRVVSAW